MSALLQSAARENAARGEPNYGRVQRTRSKRRSPARARNTKGKTLTHTHHAYKSRAKNDWRLCSNRQRKGFSLFSWNKKNVSAVCLSLFSHSDRQTAETFARIHTTPC